DDLGYYWISSYPGLSVFDPASGQTRQIPVRKNPNLHGIPWNGQGRLFSGSGLLDVEGNMENGFVLKWNDALPDTVTSSIIWLDSRDRLWTGKGMESLIVFDAKHFNLLATIPVTGLCTKILERDSNYWIASSDGLFEIHGDSLSIIRVHDKSNGMPSKGFNSMEMDKHKRLWLTYHQGVVMFDPSNDSIPISTFSQEDGLPPLQFRESSYQFEDGEIWFAAIDGITRFYPDKVHDLDIAAIPQITEIQVNDSLPKNKLVCAITGSSNFPLIQKLVFKYANNTLAFRINSLEYSSPNRNKVMYQMENLDAQPLEAASGSLVRYPNLPPGDYTFVVYAANSDGNYNTASRSIQIHINAPFYKTWWFYTLLALLTLSIVAYIIYLRFTKALELQRVRLKLYENLHDDVGSRLTAIVLSAEDLERNEKINSPKIQSISKIAKSIVENMRRLVWAIDPENDKMNNILQKITHDKSLILGDGIAFHVHIDDNLKNVVLAGEVRYQISSISNEAFNNIAKYAQATEVNVSMSRENKKLRLVIADNGKGFDPSMVTKNSLTGSGYGLDNMKRRASRVKGNLEIFSNPGEGTRIVAEFPY
ncbi:MAG TPA: ATP-binding protein, partial [Saprospiraceae bacterium]|nr:ATP-binding protein [Saprospiraceae bacterium]